MLFPGGRGFGRGGHAFNRHGGDFYPHGPNQGDRMNVAKAHEPDSQYPPFYGMHGFGPGEIHYPAHCAILHFPLFVVHGLTSSPEFQLITS